MKSDYFHFRHFSVCHSGAAMKVGTDAVLLGALAWSGGTRLLDAGTGSGLIALMLAQRNAEAHITAIDTDANAIDCAHQNFGMSTWSHRLEAFADDFLTHRPATPYDNIVSNPPFFLSAPDMNDNARRAARIAETLSPLSLIVHAPSCLGRDGRLQMIVPSDQAEHLIFEARMHNLYICRRIDIASREGKTPIRTVLDFSMQPIASPTSTLLSLADANGRRHEVFAQLVRDFYVR